MRCAVERSAEENLGIICVDQDTGKIAVSLVSYDVYNAKHKPFSPERINGGLQKIFELLELNERDETLNPQKFGDVIEILALACTKEYSGLGLSKSTVEWAMKNHPIISKAKALTASGTNPTTRILLEKIGWETQGTLDLLNYQDHNGEKTFASIKQELEKRNLFQNYQEIAYLRYSN